MDSNYDVDDETVVDHADGTYTVSYTLSSANTTAVGVYPLTIGLYDGVDRRVQVVPGLVRYAPNPTPRVAVVGDLSSEIVFEDQPAGTSGFLSVLSATLSTGTIELGDNETLSMQIWTKSALRDHIGEVGGDGYIRVVVPATNEDCDEDCTYDVEVELSLLPFSGTTLDPEGEEQTLEIGLGRSLEGEGAPLIWAPKIPGPPAWYAPIDAGPYAVVGQITFEGTFQIPSGDSDHEKYPQYTNSNPVNVPKTVDSQVLRLVDGCNNSYYGRTYADGSYQFIYDLPCPFPVANNSRVYWRSEINHSYLDIKVTNVTSDAMYEFQVGSNFTDGYVILVSEAVSYHGGDEWDVLNISQHAVTMQRWLKTWLAGNSPNAMPRLRLRWENAAGFGNKNFACLSNGCTVWDGSPFLYITKDNAGDEAAMSHEFFHWYGHYFMADQKGNGSAQDNPLYNAAGAFGEGFASMMPYFFFRNLWNQEGWNVQDSVMENMDYSGNLEDNPGGGDPYVGVGTLDSATGGWSWRILWDFFDEDEAEPVIAFARGYHDPVNQCTSENPNDANVSACTTLTPANHFDVVGHPSYFQDIIVGYLGGNLISGNEPADEQGIYHFDDRGFKGVEMTEFFDGAICRSDYFAATDVEDFALVMGFISYDPDLGPGLEACTW